MLVPCWIFLASLPLTTELVTAVQIPINNSLLVVRVEGVERGGGGGGGGGGESGEGGEGNNGVGSPHSTGEPSGDN